MAESLKGPPRGMSRSETLKAKMDARRKAREVSGEIAKEKAEQEVLEKKKASMKSMAALLGGELNKLIVEKKQADDVKDRLARGESAVDANVKLFQTLYKYSSEDPDDLHFEANEILRVFDWEDEWYEGENQEGKRGYFPNTFVREIKAPAEGKSVGGLPA
eukprot:m.136985 g.136985  ORF g.136985 m.136985 type:complete len:161 (-) comp29896_c1_seq1:69-551(-)